jgi:hypothetical protein
MKQPPISRECAASAGERVEGLIGEFTRYLPKRCIDTKSMHRARWVDGRGSSFPGYIQLRKEHLVGPGNRVKNGEGLVTFAILYREVIKYFLFEAGVHELASQTIGRLPSLLQRHIFSTTRFAIRMLPALYPLECQTVAQQFPTTSGGINRGYPARLETATKAVGSDTLWRANLDPPNILLMQAGK